MYRAFIATGTLLFVLIIVAAGYLLLSEPDTPLGPPQQQADALKLYYYNTEKDEDATGNVLCSAQGLEPVERELPLTETSIEDAIKLLIRGELTADEKSRGISTEFPLQSLTLTSAVQDGGTVALTFSDPRNRTSGGACRVSVLRAQIEATTKQFPGVENVVIEPEELFQP